MFSLSMTPFTESINDFINIQARAHNILGSYLRCFNSRECEGPLFLVEMEGSTPNLGLSRGLIIRFLVVVSFSLFQHTVKIWPATNETYSLVTQCW
jgi:hypothetical protein